MNAFALDNDDLITGLQDFASTAAATGTSLRDAMALFTGGQEIIQNASEMGNALKTISMRIRGYSEDATTGAMELDESLSNIQGDLINLTKIEGVLPEGISVYTDETKNLADETQKVYKPLTKYLGELADVWDKFSDTQKNSLLQQLFGKNRASQGSAILQNYDQVRAALETMESAEGSSVAEFEVASQTITFQLNELKQTWVGFLQDALPREVITSAIEALTDLSKAIINVLETPGLNVTAITGIATAIYKVTSSIGGLGSAITKNLVFDKTSLSEDVLSSLNEMVTTQMGGSLKGLNESQMDEILKTTKLTEEQRELAKQIALTAAAREADTAVTEANTVATQRNIDAEVEDALATANGVAAQEVSTIATELDADAQVEQALAMANGVIAQEAEIASDIADVSAENASTEAIVANTEAEMGNAAAKEGSTATSKGLLGTVLSLAKAHPLLTAAVVATTAAVGIAYNQYKKEVEYVGNLAEASDELISAYKEQTAEADNNISTAKEAYEEYSKLADGVDRYGNNIKLSDEEFERFNELSEEIAEALPELVTGYSSLGTPILECKDSVQAFNDACDAEKVQAYAMSVEELGTIFSSVSAQLNGHDGWFVDTKGFLEKKDDFEDFKDLLDEYREFLDGIDNYEDLTFTGSIDDYSSYDEIKEYYKKNATAQKYQDFQIRFSMYGNEFDFDKSILTISSQQELDEAADRLLTFNSTVKTIASDLSESESAIVAEFEEGVSVVLNNSDKYAELGDEVANGIKTYLSNFTIEDMADVIGDVDGNEELAAKNVTTHVNDMLTAIEQHKDEVNAAFAGLYSIDTSAETIADVKAQVDEYIAILAAILDEDADDLKIKLGVTYADENLQDAKNAASSLISDKNVGNIAGLKQFESEQAKLEAYVATLTESEAQAFRDWAMSVEQSYATAEEAERAWKASLEADAATATPTGIDASTLSTVATQLSTIHSAYISLQEDIADGKVGTELARSIKDVESLRESFTELGDAADFGEYSSFDAIENVLTSGKASADEMLDAYNQLATTYATAKLAAADYSEEAQAAISTQLQLAGVTEESADAFVASITAEAQAKQMVAGIDLSAMTKDELNAFLDEADAATITKEAVYLLWLQEYQMNNSSLDTTSQCQSILDIADAAGVSITSLTVLQNRMAAIGALEEYKSGSNINIVDLRRLENEVDKWSSSDAYDQVFSEFENQVSGKKIDFSSRSGSGSSGGSGSSSDAKDEYLDKFKEQYDELKELRDNDQIDEYEYVQYLRALYQKYFKNKKKYIKEYAQYEREYLSGMKSLYESVFSALTSRIDKEIDRLNAAKEAATKALESQKSAAVSSLQKQKAAAVAAIDAQIDALEDEIDAIDDEIDAYQDEIDAINDANEAREREIALQQALYDLDKLQGQRTNLVYSESQGMHYEADTSGIRDARESVQDAKDDIEIANIEKKIELLEKQKELIEDQIEELEEEKEAIEAYYDGLIEETEAYYDNLIAQSEAYYDSQINNLENSKTMIEELMEVWENAQMDKILKEMGISFDELVEKIKGGDFSALDEIFTGYSSVLKEMASGSDSLTESLGRLLNQDMSTIPNFLQETAAAFEGVENVNLDLVNEGLETFKQNLESLPNSDAVKQMFGENLSDSFNQGLSEVETGLNQFLASDTVTGFAERFASTLDLTNKDGELITAFKSIGTNSSEGYAEGLADESAKENVNTAVDDLTGVDDDSSSQGAAGRARDNVQTHSPSEVFKKIGEYCGQGLALGLSEAMNDPEVTGQIDQAMETFVEKIQTAIQQIDFSAMLDSMGASGEDDVGFFEGMLTGIQSFIEELGNLDITPITALVEQFTTLKQTISDVSMAISGGGMSEDSEGGESQGGGGSSGGGKSGSSGGKSGGKSQSSGEGGSLVEALQTLGSTSEEVIGSAEDEEGGSGESEGTGMIGQFKNLKTAVQDVTASIGTDETGEGGESGGGEGGEDGESTTLIGAMNTLSEVALNEETGIPKHIDLWHKMNDSIHEAAESLHEFRSELEELVGVTWECHVFKEYAEGSGSSADGTASKAIGTMTGIGYAYARGKNIGLESDQRALVGEIGYEGLCRNGQFSLIGQQGAQMMDLKKGDIIFSHSQTKNLLKNGKINGRGKVIGAHSYADGTPLNKAFSFGGNDYTSSALEQLSARLTGNVESIDTNIKTMTNDVSTVARSYTTVPTNTMSQSTNVTIGDIHLSGVQNPDGLAKAIKSYLPGKMLQELHK